MKRFGRHMACAAGLLLCSLLWGTGCASTDVDRRESEIPWNQPQTWEGSPYIPGLNRY